MSNTFFFVNNRAIKLSLISILFNYEFTCIRVPFLGIMGNGEIISSQSREFQQLDSKQYRTNRDNEINVYNTIHNYNYYKQVL